MGVPLKVFTLIIGLSWVCALGLGQKSTTVPIATTSVSETTTVLNNETCNAADGNCTMTSTTIAPTTTTTKSKSKHEKSKWKNAHPQNTYYKFKQGKQPECYCDLQNRVCEINCCCDNDCSLEAKQVFSFCKDEQFLHSKDTSYCNYMQYIYNNRTLHEYEVQQNTLFCIAKTNLPPHYYHQKKKIIVNPLHANDVIDKSPTYQWANPDEAEGDFGQNLPLNLTNHTAIYGDNLYMLKNYSKPFLLEISDNFVSPDCIISKPVEYLKDIQTSCRQTLNYQNPQLFLQFYQGNLTVLSSLRFLNVSLDNYEGCPKNVCVEINLRQCDALPCRNLSKNLHAECNSKMCTNIVTSVNYKFYHNGTFGIQNINLDLILTNITMPPTFIDQQFSVKFLWHNQTEFNFTDARSGNPGYIVGKPVLTGRLLTIANITTNSTTNITITSLTTKLQRPFDKFIQNYLVFPKNVKGKCVLSNDIYEPVEFGYNMLTKCLHVQGFTRKANMTHNETCWQLQNNILAYWSLDVDPKQHANTSRNNSFAHFGNAQNNNLKDWGHFLFDVFPEELLNETFGREVTNNTIECQNISTAVKYNIFYERVEDEQARISAIYVEFANLKLVKLHVFNNNVFPDIRLTSEVMFYDVTGVRNLKYVDPPSLDIKLPYDFFYPFVRIENSGFNLHKRINIALISSAMLVISLHFT